jgi:hypothetical protein
MHVIKEELDLFEKNFVKILCQKTDQTRIRYNYWIVPDLKNNVFDGIRTWNSKVLGAPQRVQGGGLARSGRLLVQRRGAPRRQ